VLDSLASIGAPEVLFAELGRVLDEGGGLGCTAEVGRPLSPAERARFTRTSPPTVVDEQELRGWLGAAGFEIVSLTDCTPDAARVARRLADGLVDRRASLTRELGRDAVEDLAATLASLAELLGSGRVAEVQVVARRYGTSRSEAARSMAWTSSSSR
jgi:hypothetical protein